MVRKTRSPSSRRSTTAGSRRSGSTAGRRDFLLDQNRAFHAHLEKLQIPHEYQEFPGDHNWAYWDLHVREAIAFHVKNLKLR